MMNRYKSHMRHLGHEMKHGREISLETGIDIETRPPAHERPSAQTAESTVQGVRAGHGYYIDGYRPEEIARALDKSIQIV